MCYDCLFCPSTLVVSHMEAVSGTVVGKSCLHKLRDVFDLVLPVLEGQVDVVTQLVDHILGSLRLADHGYFLVAELVDSDFNEVKLFPESRLLAFGVEANDGFEDFLVSKTDSFSLDLSFQLGYFSLYLSVIFLHGVIVCNNRLSDLLFKIIEEPFD